MIFAQLTPEAIIGVALALVIGITCHEFSHAFVADLLGDHRPRALGRISLNPMRHIDPLGAVFFILAGFGWGRPVPVNVYALRNGRAGMAWVAGAGPLTNFVVALIFAVLLRVLLLVGLDDVFLLNVVYFVVLLNIVLGLFNFIPIPPLDGYNFVLAFLPPRQVFAVQRYAQYGFLALLVLIFLSYTPGGGPIGYLFHASSFIAQLLVGG